MTEKHPELRKLLDRTTLQLSEDIGRLEATLDLVESDGILLNPQVISVIHNSSRGVYINLTTSLIWGGEVNDEMYARVIKLLGKAERLLGKDIHATYERKRITDIVSLAKEHKPELNQYLSIPEKVA